MGQQSNSNANAPSDDAWLSAKPQLRPELQSRVRREDNRFVATIEDPTRSKFFQVGYEEYRFISMLDGRRSLEQIHGLMNSGQSNAEFSLQSAQAIFHWLINNNLILGNGSATTERLSTTARQKNTQQLLGLLNPLCFKFNLLNPNKFLLTLKPWTQWVFSRWMLFVWVALAIWSYVEVSDQYERFSQSAAGILAPGKWLWLLLIWCLLKMVHETAHGIACVKYGGEVRRGGVLFLLFAPLAFVDVTSSWRMSSRRNRIIVAAAGMYVELLIAFAAALVWARSDTGMVAEIAYNIVVMAGISTVLFNANPLIRFDGYYILSDILGVVNLYPKGQMWFNDRIRNLLFGFARSETICPRGELLYVGLYGSISFIWRIMLSLSLLLVASTFFDGAGLILALIGGVFWIGLPLFKNLQQIVKTASSQKIKWRRFSFCLAVIGVGVTSIFFWIQAPALTRAPVIVQFQDEHVLRAATDGFVSDIRVRNGQWVKQGEPLIVLTNPQLDLELEDLTLAAETARITARIHQQKKQLSLYQAEKNRLLTIGSQIEEIQGQIAQQTLRAPIDGVVYQRGLKNLKESFVHQGDPILRIANPSAKELLVSLDQNQIKTFRANMDSPIRVAFAGLPLMTTAMTTVEPRASDSLAHPSMGANAGGPLQVRPFQEDSTSSSESGFRLIKPRFTAKLQLADDSANELWSGQLGTAFVKGQDHSFGGYLYERCRQWVQTTLKSAAQSGK